MGFLQAVGRIAGTEQYSLEVRDQSEPENTSRTSESNVNVKSLLVIQQLKKYQ
jgi:hypothetical protein